MCLRFVIWVPLLDWRVSIFRSWEPLGASFEGGGGGKKGRWKGQERWERLLGHGGGEDARVGGAGGMVSRVLAAGLRIPDLGSAIQDRGTKILCLA